MKAKFILALFCGLLFTGLNAQTTTANVNSTMGGLIALFAEENLSPNAFTADFAKNKKGWLEKANMTNDPKGAAWLLKSLQAGLVSSAFKPTWATEKDKWLAACSIIKTQTELDLHINTLANYISPSMLMHSW